MSVKLTLEFENTKSLLEYLKGQHEAKKPKAKKKEPKMEVKLEPKVEDIPKLEVPIEPEDVGTKRGQKEVFAELMLFLKDTQRGLSAEDVKEGIKRVRAKLNIPTTLKMKDATVEQLEAFLNEVKAEFIEL